LSNHQVSHKLFISEQFHRIFFTLRPKITKGKWAERTEHKTILAQIDGKKVEINTKPGKLTVLMSKYLFKKKR
jgi:Fe-S cluster biosynthesis and repair protein YggX